MKMTPENFMAILLSLAKQSGSPFKLGTIQGDYVSGRPKIVFDGETATSEKTYPYLGSYTPTAGDRVLVAMVGHSGVVIGKIV